MDDIIELIDKERRKRFWSHKELIEKVHISRASYFRYKRNKNPPLDVVEDFFKVLGICDVHLNSELHREV